MKEESRRWRREGGGSGVLGGKGNGERKGDRERQRE